MLAAVCRATRTVEIERLDTPAPGPGEMLLDMICCGLCGTDLHKIDQGTHAGQVLGHEVVGVVTALGPGVTSFQPGDRVVTPHHVACGVCRLCRSGATTRCDTFQQDLLAPGGFAEKILVRPPAVERAARRIPDAMVSEAAVFLEPAACVLRGIDRASLDESATPVATLVLGAGSMGLLHVHLLRALFPEGEIAVSEPSPERRRAAERAGADRVFDPSELSANVAGMAEGRGFDAAFDTVGHPSVVDEALVSLRSGGSLVLFAHSGSPRLSATHQALFHEERQILGTYSGALDEQQRVWDLLVDGRLSPQSMVTHQLPLSRFDEALQLVREPATLKILMMPG